MAGPNQLGDPDGRDAESGAVDQPSHATTNDTISAPFADTDRFGKTQVGDEGDRQRPIPGPRNHLSDGVWGVNDTAGGSNPPDAPGITVASK